MKKSIVIATTLVAGAGATGAGAAGSVPDPYYGSDTLGNVTQTAITNAGLSAPAFYLAGGSGTGQATMASRNPDTATQQTAPMSKMLTSGACVYNLASPGSAGTFTTNATGIVVGMDAVDILSSVTTGAAAACNGAAGSSGDQTGKGLAYNNSSVFGSSGNATNSLQNWKYILALVYGGKDITTGKVDCTQTARQNLVNNWSLLFQDQANCQFAAGSVCADGDHNGVLWHAYRRDEASGTSDVFSSLIGISPSTSQSSNNGFGASPYCNALNWDTDANNNGTVKVAGAPGNCSFGGHDQWTGPGGIVDPNSVCTIGNAATCLVSNNVGDHRRPPAGTWGDNPDSTQTTNSADVLPTDMQDNDPIRRPCIGNAANAGKSGEDTCNLDGKLGLVQVVPASDFIPALTTNAGNTVSGLSQYPTTACSGSFIEGNPVNVLNCAPFKASVHSGECPNGDSLFGGTCFVPVSGTSSQCFASSSISPTLTNRTLPTIDGRIYNLHMRDGDLNDGTCQYIKQIVQTGGTPLSLDFVGGSGRIHSVNTIFATASGQVGCQMVDATDEIGCTVAADPCSIGYAGDGGKSWNQRADGTLTPASGTLTDGIRIDQVYPQASSAQLMGVKSTATGIEYQIGRKLYFNSIIGFGNILAPGVDTSDTASAGGELALAEYESTSAIGGVLTGVGYFTTGTQGGQLGAPNTTTLVGSGGTAGDPFCEDFNQQLVCGASAPTNDNACGRNPSGVVSDTNSNPATTVNSTVCGNGLVEAFEECDPGATATGATATCSTTCRCTGRTSYEPNGTGGYACQ